MDWNNDGKHDWKDHAFYNNVISQNDKSEASSSSKSTNSSHNNNSSEASSNCGLTVFIALILVYMFLKLIGG